jgi:hypothetical protein
MFERGGGYGRPGDGVQALAAKAGAGLEARMIRKLKSGGYRLYSRKKNPKTGRRRNLGTFKTRAAAEKHERAVQYFKRG